jgi:hypothetical protein
LWLFPFKLASQPGVIEHRDRAFGPLAGLFDDSLLDRWGLLLMGRYFATRAGHNSPAAWERIARIHAMLLQAAQAAAYYDKLLSRTPPNTHTIEVLAINRELHRGEPGSGLVLEFSIVWSELLASAMDAAIADLFCALNSDVH